MVEVGSRTIAQIDIIFGHNLLPSCRTISGHNSLKREHDVVVNRMGKSGFSTHSLAWTQTDSVSCCDINSMDLGEILRNWSPLGVWRREH